MRMRKGLVAAGLAGALTFGPATVAGAGVGDVRAPVDTPATTTEDSGDSGGSGAWGLLGLVGLAGLLGLRKRRDTADVDGRRSFGEAMTSSTVS
jgi:MYXO-CTERM domain-containing protein